MKLIHLIQNENGSGSFQVGLCPTISMIGLLNCIGNSFLETITPLPKEVHINYIYSYLLIMILQYRDKTDLPTDFHGNNSVIFGRLTLRDFTGFFKVYIIFKIISIYFP